MTANKTSSTTSRATDAMTPAEYQAALDKIEISQRGFCLEVIRVDDSSGRKWLAGTNPVPGSVAALLRLAVALKLKAADLRELAKKRIRH